eukprot:352399-Chlamydomonas_euryale.AAC.1
MSGEPRLPGERALPHPTPAHSPHTLQSGEHRKAGERHHVRVARCQTLASFTPAHTPHLHLALRVRRHRECRKAGERHVGPAGVKRLHHQWRAHTATHARDASRAHALIALQLSTSDTRACTRDGCGMRVWMESMCGASAGWGSDT